MREVSVHERHARAYRHELRTLTYVTLDDAKAGVLRNLNRQGVALQAVSALHPQQSVRLRFELKFPRLRVETSGQVSWATPTGLCGIRFVNLPARTGHQIDEWIFASLLNATVRGATHAHSMFGGPVVSIAREENDPEENVSEESEGLTVSAAARPAIRLEPAVAEPILLHRHVEPDDDPYVQLNWLSRPISGRTLTWLVDGLVVTAAVLLFALIFLSIAHELPPWPLTLGAAAAIVVGAGYWAVFAFLGGSSVGARLARAVSGGEERDEGEDAVRIR